MQKKLAMLQRHLELDSDLTRFQPPQVSVLNDEDGTVRCVLLTTVELFYRHQALLASGCSGRGGGVVGGPSSPLPSGMLGGSNFRISERYRCVADHRGQVQGGVGFIFEGIDMLDRNKVRQSQASRFSFGDEPFVCVGVTMSVPRLCQPIADIRTNAAAPVWRRIF